MAYWRVQKNELYLSGMILIILNWPQPNLNPLIALFLSRGNYCGLTDPVKNINMKAITIDEIDFFRIRIANQAVDY